MISRPESVRSKSRSQSNLDLSQPSSPLPPTSPLQHSPQLSLQQQESTSSLPLSISNRASLDNASVVSEGEIRQTTNSASEHQRPYNQLSKHAWTHDSDSEDGEDILEFRVGDQDSILRSVENTSAPVVVKRWRSSTQAGRPSVDTSVQVLATPSEERIANNTQKNEVKPVGADVEGPNLAASHQTAGFTANFGRTSVSLPPVEETEWQDMLTVASYEVYDDRGNVIVHTREEKKASVAADEDNAANGYTRVTIDEDTRSLNSLDEKADYLFDDYDDDELNRNPLKQLQSTKNMLTVAQRIAYVGLCKVITLDMARHLARLRASKKATKSLTKSMDSLSVWSQTMMIRLYSHMDISPEEQIMIEQLGDHGVIPSDLTPSLMIGAKVRNPMAEDDRSSDKHVEEPVQVESSAQDADDLKITRPDELRDQETIEIDVRWTLLCDLFLVLISDSVYDSRSRNFLERTAAALEVSTLEVAQFEKKVTDALEIEEGSKQTWDEQDIMDKRRKAALRKKYAYVGLATVGGGLVIGLSAGLLAPVIGAGLAAGFTTIGITGTSTFLAGAGGAAVVTTAGTLAGAKIGSQGMSNRMGHVRTFEFRPLHNNKRVNLIVTVSGWMSGKEDDVRLPFSTIDPIMGDLFSVLWEPEMLLSMGHTINILASEVLTQSIQQVLGATVLTALMASIQLPMLLSKLSYLLDNPWSVSLDRAWAAGLIMADTIMNRNLGVRPITLIGFSLGARVIYSCLVELSRKGAYGLVQDVYIYGAPVVVKQDQYALARSVVSGRFVNGYSRKDWILGYLFRATSGGLGRVAGLAPVEMVGDVDNFDCTELVEGHMAYRKLIPKLLKMSGFEVVSEEFTEIEDPDPERHREKQRELKQELEEARKQMQDEADKLESKQRKKGMFGWLKTGRRKEWWEKTEGGTEMGEAEVSMQKGDVMFDLDAIEEEISNLEGGKTAKIDKNAILPGTSEEDKKKEAPGRLDEYEVEPMPGTHPGIQMVDHDNDNAEASEVTAHKSK